MNGHPMPGDLLRDAPGDNLLADGRAAVTYREMQAWVGAAEAWLAASPAAAAQCVALEPRNTLGHCAVLLALLRRQTNCFLLSGHASPARGVPGFCDVILEVEEPGPAGGPGPACLRAAENPGCAGRAPGLGPRDGLVFFASSGTTGAPKYIRYRAADLVGNARNCVARFGLTPGSRVLVPVPVSHMYGLGAGLLPALAAGAGMCLVEKTNVVKLYDKLLRFGPTLTLLTPSLCRMLLQLDKDISGGGAFVTAGDRMPKETYAAFERRYGRLVNLYGSTEMGAIATSAPGSDPAGRAEGVVTPLDGVRVRLSDPEKGEILCAHPAAFAGYVDAAGAPVPPPPGHDGWYRTRDIGAPAGADGFRVLGRADHCVNRNGFLVSLQEIEALLEDLFTEISQVVVVPSTRETVMGTGLVAVSQLKGSHRPAEEAIRRSCRDHVPRHLIPEEFYFVDQLPRLGNGKPDRNMLGHAYGSSPRH